MILSHKYKFIFIKTNKTAGTSIEIALAKFCGEKDIITPNDPADEDIRNRLGYPKPQHCYSPVSDYRFRDIYKIIVRHKRKLKFYHHMPATEIKELVGDTIWNDYYKFCFERSPWDRVISFYYWRYKSDPRPSITEFIDSDEILLLKKYGLQRYTINGNVVVDRVCRFEKLQEELGEVSRILGFPETITLPKAKGAFRKDKRHYRDILNAEDAKKIERIFSKEIELFGYEF